MNNYFYRLLSLAFMSLVVLTSCDKDDDDFSGLADGISPAVTMNLFSKTIKDGEKVDFSGTLSKASEVASVLVQKDGEDFKSFTKEDLAKSGNFVKFSYTGKTADVKEKPVTFSITITDVNGKKYIMRDILVKVDHATPAISFKGGKAMSSTVAGDKVVLEGSVASLTDLEKVWISILKDKKLVDVTTADVDLAKGTFKYEQATTELDTTITFVVRAINKGTKEAGKDSVAFKASVLTKLPVLTLSEEVAKKVAALDTVKIKGSFEVLKDAELKKFKFFRDGVEITDEKLVKVDTKAKTFSFYYPATEAEVAKENITLTVKAFGEFRGKEYVRTNDYKLKVTTSKPAIEFTNKQIGTRVKVGTPVKVTGTIASPYELTTISVSKDGKAFPAATKGLSVDLKTGAFSYTYTPDVAGEFTFTVEAINKRAKEAGKVSADYVVTVVK